MRAINIVWDTDGERIDDLPTEVSIDVGVAEEDVADYLSDDYGFCIKSLDIVNDIDLGAFSIDVMLQGDGTFDVWIAHEGSSGSHYKDVTADMIGKLIAEEIEVIAEAYQNG